MMKSSTFVHNISLIKNSAGCAWRIPARGLGGWVGVSTCDCGVREANTLGGAGVEFAKGAHTPHRQNCGIRQGPECCGEAWVAMLNEMG